MSYFITLEGPDGSGKTSQAERLSTHLTNRGYDVLLSREPGGTSISDQIRKILFSHDNTAMHPRTEFLLFSASRAQHVAQTIRPHLEAGGVVVCDRFYDSSLAYQGYGQELDLEILKSITRFATDGLTPDLTILLDLPCEEGLARRKRGGSWNRLDAYEVDFHERVAKGYHMLAAADPERWKILDAMQSEETLQAQIRQIVLANLDDSSG